MDFYFNNTVHTIVFLRQYKPFSSPPVFHWQNRLLENSNCIINHSALTFYRLILPNFLFNQQINLTVVDKLNIYRLLIN